MNTLLVQLLVKFFRSHTPEGLQLLQPLPDFYIYLGTLFRLTHDAHHFLRQCIQGVIGVAARAADVLALDTPYFHFRDPEGLRANALAAKKYGYKGKLAIHPAQIDIINEAFSPSNAEIEHARRVIEAFEEAERRGRGSTSLDGKVVDVPVVKRAQALLEFAKATSGVE